MIWNWQQADWPEFWYSQERIDPFERRFLKESGMLLGAFRHLNAEEKQALTIELISEEAQKTSEIEGEFLRRSSVQSSIRRQLGLSSDSGSASPAERGIAEMMVDLYQFYQQPLTHQTLFHWHEQLTRGRRDLSAIGTYRIHEEPMQVVSGPIHQPRIHFQAPPSARVPAEMDRFIEWFNSPDPATSPTPLARAGLAHLYFISIHPFEDGNGRIGRAISMKALAQGLGQPALVALAQRIESRKSDYYEALEQANKSNEVTEWLAYFADTVLKSQQRALELVEFLIAKTRFFDRLRDKLNERQLKVLNRVFSEGPDGFQGGLSAENYIRISKTSRATATRDLAALVEMGALRRTGELKSTRYHLILKEQSAEARFPVS